MNNLIRRKRGKRGGEAARAKVLRDIHSSIDGLPSGHHAGHAHNLKGKSTLLLAEQAAKYFDCALIQEHAETHCIPRKSVTVDQLLQCVPQQVEQELVPCKHLDVKTGKVEILYSKRTTWKSDRSLLVRGNPFELQESYKREGTISEGSNTRKYTAAIHGDEAFEVEAPHQVIVDLEDEIKFNH